MMTFLIQSHGQIHSYERMISYLALSFLSSALTLSRPMIMHIHSVAAGSYLPGVLFLSHIYRIAFQRTWDMLKSDSGYWPGGNKWW